MQIDRTSDTPPRGPSEILLTNLNRQLQWMNDQQVYEILKAVLHSIRDRLPHAQAAYFETQLPTLFKKAFRERWQPRQPSERFLDDVGSRLDVLQRLHLTASVPVVMKAIRSRFLQGEIRHLPALQAIILELGQGYAP
jgi:uncharacterized protein (DUF2267 family)